jgi:uncharacterized protein
LFLSFFYSLKKFGIPVSLQEFFDFLKAVEFIATHEKHINLKRLHLIARIAMVKDIRFFDQFDQAFATHFESLVTDQDFKQKLHQWLSQAHMQQLDEERKKNALNIPNENLLKELEKRLQEQKDQHHGGNHWIGTGGTSSFGHSGYNPNGLRIGGASQSRSALSVLGPRSFQAYRTDQQLQTRNMKVALKGLRLLKKQGRAELSIPKSIAATCQNAGEIQIVEERSRKNALKLILLLDIGGSMTVHSQQVEKLFSALHQLQHFKSFKAYYFHNIIYDHVYEKSDLTLKNAIYLPDLYAKFNEETRVIILGDAAMSPFEYWQMSGALRHAYDFYGRARDYPLAQVSSFTGEQRLMEIKTRYPHLHWLNPDPIAYWDSSTTRAIKEIVPMSPLTIDGLHSIARNLSQASS